MKTKQPKLKPCPWQNSFRDSKGHVLAACFAQVVCSCGAHGPVALDKIRAWNSVMRRGK